jgi:hypothetical protein
MLAWSSVKCLINALTVQVELRPKADVQKLIEALRYGVSEAFY